jgi:hypothetical protein
MKIRYFIPILACYGLVVSCAHRPDGTPPMARVEGRVLDRDGAPMVGASIILSPDHSRSPLNAPQSAWWRVDVRARTDSMGIFSVRCPKSHYRMDVDADGRGVPWMRRHIEVSQDIRNLDLRFDGTYLTGRVVGRDGKEPEYIHASAMRVDSRGGSGAIARYAGRSPYRLLVPPGNYHLIVGGQDYHDSTLAPLDTLVTVPDHDDSLNVVVAGNNVSVRLTTTRGLPRSGMSINFLSPAGNPYETYNYGWTDSAGQAVMHVRSGLYSVLVRSPHEDMVPWCLVATVRSDTVLAFELAPIRWTGAVRSSTTRMPINAEIYLYQPNHPGATGRVRCDSTGKFVALIRPGATYDGCGSMTGYEMTRFPLTLLADSTFDLYLEPKSPTPAPPAGPSIPGRGSSGR